MKNIYLFIKEIKNSRNLLGFHLSMYDDSKLIDSIIVHNENLPNSIIIHSMKRQELIINHNMFDFMVNWLLSFPHCHITCYYNAHNYEQTHIVQKLKTKLKLLTLKSYLLPEEDLRKYCNSKLIPTNKYSQEDIIWESYVCNILREKNLI